MSAKAQKKKALRNEAIFLTVFFIAVCLIVGFMAYKNVNSKTAAPDTSGAGHIHAIIEDVGEENISGVVTEGHEEEILPFPVDSTVLIPVSAVSESEMATVTPGNMATIWYDGTYEEVGEDTYLLNGVSSVNAASIITVGEDGLVISSPDVTASVPAEQQEAEAEVTTETEDAKEEPKAEQEPAGEIDEKPAEEPDEKPAEEQATVQETAEQSDKAVEKDGAENKN